MVADTGRPATAAGVEEMLSVTEVARMLSVSPRTLDNWRSASRGPAYHKLEHTVRYRVGDVLAWLEASRVETLDTLDILKERKTP